MCALTLPEPLWGTIPPVQATSDEHLALLWLHDRPANTRRAYARDAAAFLAIVARPLRETTLGDGQRWADSLGHLAPATQARAINAIKSLFRIANRLGYLAFKVAGALRVPIVKNVLAERILSELDVQRVLALEPDARNRVLLRLLYTGGLRVSELPGSSGATCSRATAPAR
jgi:integrase/recombinase XerD